MDRLIPPTIYGPLTPLSPAVRVTGVLAGATVTIFEGAVQIGSATAAQGGELMVPVTSQPVVNSTITATQTSSEGTSEASSQPMTVVDVPNPLPTPVILSALNSCMADILAGGLVPGATVVTTIGGATFAEGVAQRPAGKLYIDGNKPITPNTQAQLQQHATIGGLLRASNVLTSPNVPAFTYPTDHLAPPEMGPFVQCDTQRVFQQVIAGAITTIEDGTNVEAWFNESDAFTAAGGLSLQAGTAVVQQAMPRCGRVGDPATLPIAPPPVPGAPVCSQDACPQALRLTVSGLFPGGVLHIGRIVVDSPNGFRETLVGDAGIATETQQIDLPADLKLTDPDGPVFIALSQERCGMISNTTRVAIAPAAGPFAPPTIRPPLMDCCRGIPIVGAQPGAIVQAVDAISGAPLSDVVGVTQTSMFLFPWFPLSAGREVQVRQRGCNADGVSHTVAVESLPIPLPTLKIVGPVRPQAPSIKVTGVVPGARVSLFVNNALRPIGVDVYATEGVIPVSGAPLAVGDLISVFQALCSETSGGEQAVVTRGNLRLSVTPLGQIPRGKTTDIRVDATDADTGAPVSAPVLINSALVGITGMPFQLTPKVGDPNPSGLVQGGVAYNNAAFTIALAAPTWNLFLHAGPLPPILDQTRIDVTQMKWQVTPDWSAGAATTATISPGASSSAGGSTALPQPTGTVKTVTVTISATCSTPGGTINGSWVAAGSVPFISNTVKVAFSGSDETVGWLLQPNYATDPTSGQTMVNLQAIFAGITP